MAKIKVRLSELRAAGYTEESFDDAVVKFRDAKLKHRFTTGVPAPGAPHPLVEAAVLRVPPAGPDDFVLNYEVVDDTPSPPPPPTFEEKKAALVGLVARLEREAVAIVIPPTKARLLGMELQRAHSKKPEERTTEDQGVIAAHNERMSKIEPLQFHAAKLMADIGDLTEANIDAWKPKPFPKVA